MTDLADLAADLLANFHTVRIPASERREDHADWWTRAKARQVERRAAYAARDRLRQGLVKHGYRCFLDRMEPDPDGGWRLHFFVPDDAALPLLDELTEGTVGHGDPMSFDPEEFVLEGIRYLIENNTHS
jgi:hypothetical protein